MGPSIDKQPLGDYILTKMRVTTHNQTEECEARNGGFWTWATKSTIKFTEVKDAMKENDFESPLLKKIRMSSYSSSK